MMLVATAVLASDTFFAVSFLGESLCKKYIVALSTVGYTICPAFAVLQLVNSNN